MTQPHHPRSSTEDEDEDDSALLDALDNDDSSDPTLTHLRESRIQQLSAQLKAAKQARLQAQGHGSHGTLTRSLDEKAVLETTTSVSRCIVHFYKPSFRRCGIMDGHLSALASAHVEVRFLKIDVEDAPFLVAKLGVKVLPCVIGFVDGVGVERVVGFEGLGGGGDGFETGELERRLVRAGVLEGEKMGVVGVGDGDGGMGKRGDGGKRDGDDDDDDDDDDWD